MKNANISDTLVHQKEEKNSRKETRFLFVCILTQSAVILRKRANNHKEILRSVVRLNKNNIRQVEKLVADWHASWRCAPV